MSKSINTAAKAITGTRTAKAADKRGPKAGSARANQSARQVNPDHILSVANAITGNGMVVTSVGGETIVRSAMTKEFLKLAQKGLSFKALKAYVEANKPTAKLARGIAQGDAPHSAKAVSDAKGKADKAAPAPKAKSAAKGKDRTVKAAANKQPSKGTDRAYTKGTKKDESKPDTFRKYMLSTILAHKSTAAAKAAHAASGQYPSHKLDFNWSAQQGYIVLK